MLKMLNDAMTVCDEVIRDSKKLRSKELRQFIEEYVNAQKEIIDDLRKKVN